MEPLAESTEHLRVSIANERTDQRERPEAALVGLGESSRHAPGLIDKIVCEATCPVLVLHAPDPRFLTGRLSEDVNS